MKHLEEASGSSATIPHVPPKPLPVGGLALCQRAPSPECSLSHGFRCAVGTASLLVGASRKGPEPRISLPAAHSAGWASVTRPFLAEWPWAAEPGCRAGPQ